MENSSAAAETVQLLAAAETVELLVAAETEEGPEEGLRPRSSTPNTPERSTS